MPEIPVHSLSLAAALLANNLMPLVRAQQGRNGKCQFVFEGGREEFDRIEKDFHADRLMVPAKSFSAWRADLKQAVYALTANSNNKKDPQ